MGKQTKTKHVKTETELKLLAYGQWMVEQGHMTEAEMRKGLKRTLAANEQAEPASNGNGKAPESSGGAELEMIEALDVEPMVAALRALLDRAERLVTCPEPSRAHLDEIWGISCLTKELRYHAAVAEVSGMVLDGLIDRLSARSCALAEVYNTNAPELREVKTISFAALLGESSFGMQLTPYESIHYGAGPDNEDIPF